MLTLLFWLLLAAVGLTVGWFLPPKARRPAQLLLATIAVALLIAGANILTPELRLLTASLAALYVVKAIALLQTQPKETSRTGKLLHSTIWPGMDAAPFQKKEAPRQEDAKPFVSGLLCLYIGVTLLLATAFASDRIPTEAQGWLGLLALLLIVHLGLGGILTALLRLAGWRVPKLFDNPWQSQTLADFWTRRWNRPFVEMDRILLLRPLTRRFGIKAAVFGVFLISGLLHEMAISYPVGQSYGGPLLYFAIQGAAVLLEKHLKLRSRTMTWLVILAPVPLLFHSAFRHQFLEKLVQTLHQMLTQTTASAFFDQLLWLMAAAQLAVLLASSQVPKKLGWKEELPRLSPFNRKLMWTYGAFIVQTILGFGIMTLILHRPLLNGDPTAMALATFIAIFWTARLLTDALYFSHEDWPKGPEYEIGHALLNSLFAFLVLSYGSLIAWHAMS